MCAINGSLNSPAANESTGRRRSAAFGSPRSLRRAGRTGDAAAFHFVKCGVFDRTRWAPKDGELCPDGRGQRNSGGGRSVFCVQIGSSDLGLAA
ncbi:hypothetical protein JTE90_026912 [Oedothorax gibbosus]|uniref:Uncharacterized protein n=1 Tax=Oedothorax gibbosus TaxID=931172 RepID=A0AAV6TCT9_9ARAC|nr:hypothetical protein JTE90_026912 [Oedothorax gibbosus]